MSIKLNLSRQGKWAYMQATDLADTYLEIKAVFNTAGEPEIFEGEGDEPGVVKIYPAIDQELVGTWWQS